MANATFQPGYSGNIWVDHPDFLPLCTRVLAANWNIRRHCPIAVSSVYSFEYEQKKCAKHEGNYNGGRGPIMDLVRYAMANGRNARQ